MKIAIDFLKQLPDDGKFDMDVFLHTDADHNDTTPCEYNLIHTCGYAACVIGWTPSMPGMPKPSMYESWDEYAYHVYGLDALYWDWCFSDMWSAIDNTPKGAAARMQYLLDNPDMGEGWGYDTEFLKGRGVYHGG